jgi:4-hydroxybenzoate polyprenyltransferase
MKAGHFNFGNLAWFMIIPLLAFGYSYPLNPWNKKSLREVGWLKMASLSFIWSFTTVVLPVLMLTDDINNHPGNRQVTVLFIHRFFFIAALSFLFNIHDFEDDKKDGIKTFAVLLGPRKSLQYGKWIMIMVNGGTAFLLLFYFNLFHPAYYTALLLPVIGLFLLYHRFSAGKNEAAFAIRHDGLMIVKALLLIFAVLTTSS